MNTDKKTEQLACITRGIAECTVTVEKLDSFLENCHMTQQAHPWASILENENSRSHKNLFLNVYSGSGQSLQNLETTKMPSSG